MRSPSELNDEELRQELQDLGFNSAPVTSSTRSVLEKKLIKLRGSSSPPKTPTSQGRDRSSSASSSGKKSPGRPRKSVATNATLDFTAVSNNSTPPSSPPKQPSPRRSSASRNSTTSSSSRRSIPSRSNIPSPVVIAASEQSDNELDLSAASKPTFKRTPTPPRPSLSAQRQFDTNKWSVPTRQTDRPRRLYSEPDDELNDESMESSRVLSSSERKSFGRPSRTSTSSYTSIPPRQGRNVTQPQKESPVEKLKRFGASASQYFQDTVGGRFGYVRHESERGAFGTPGGRLSPIRITRHASPTSQSTNDIPKLLVMIFGSFTCVLALAYLFTANSQTISRTNKLISASVSDTASFIYNYAIFPTIMITILFGLSFIAFFVWKKRRVARQLLERRTMELVDKIADRVRNAGDNGVAEQHLRDSILPPTRRNPRDMEIWENAVTFINNMDSRMRSESRLINGIECNVWIWVNAHDISGGRAWQKNRSPPTSVAHTPLRALTRCLKIRDLADDSSENDMEIKREVYSKLRPITPIHFAINRSPTETYVYLMLRDLDEAKEAFDTFHAQWFKYTGAIASVKYVQDNRYNDRFPETLGL